MIKNYAKFTILALLFAVFAAGCGSKKSGNVDNYKVQEKDTINIKKDQYRVAEIFEGNKNQIIDLIKGPASFNITHEGQGPFKCTLMYADGTIVDVLADVTGDYKGKKNITVPETRAYVLDVKTDGKWSVYRE